MIVHSIYRIQKRLKLEPNDCILTMTDYKRQSGLLIAGLIPAVIGCHSVIFPFTVSKQKPSLWIETAFELSVSIIAATSKELGRASAVELITNCDTRKKPYPDLSEIRACIVMDGASPWAVTYATGVAAQLTPFYLNIATICPLVWSDLAGVVALRDVTSDLVTTAFSREYLSFGVIREKASMEPDHHAIHAYHNGKVLAGLELAVVKPIRQPFDDTESPTANYASHDSLQLTRTDEVGEIVLSGTGLDHQHFLSLENAGDRIFRCQVSSF